MKKIVAAAALSTAMVGLVAAPAIAAHEGSVYTGDLNELNSSGASGSTKITVSDDGETMTVEVTADGLNLDGPHAMHIHGIVDGDTVLPSSCPTMAEDADGDGVVTVLEGAVKYGSVQVSLTTEGDTSSDSALAVERYPAGDSVRYVRSGIPIPDVLKPSLGKMHVVVHGIDENGNGMLDLDQDERSSLTDDLPREGTAPALCGTLAAVAAGPIQTGAGGLAATGADDDLGLALALTGAGLAGLAGTTAIRMNRRIVKPQSVPAAGRDK